MAATGAIGIRHLARADSRVLGLFGSGQQAEAQVRAIAAAQPLDLIKVYSPNPTHRNDFVARLADEVGVEMRAVDDPESVVSDSDIVVTAPISSGA